MLGLHPKLHFIVLKINSISIILNLIWMNFVNYVISSWGMRYKRCHGSKPHAGKVYILKCLNSIMIKAILKFIMPICPVQNMKKS
ncbi:hypothetical protein D3C73_1199670 [compost metagenome]